MIYLDASSILLELRSIRTALQHHSTELCHRDLTPALELVDNTIKGIENVWYALSPLDWSSAQAGMGSSELRGHSDHGSSTGRCGPDAG